MKMDLHENNDLINETHFCNNGVTGRLVLTQRQMATGKWHIQSWISTNRGLNNWAVIFTCKTLVNYLLFAIHLILNYSDFELSFPEVFSFNMRGNDDNNRHNFSSLFD